MRKDLFSYVSLAVIFWLADRATNSVPAQAVEGTPEAPGALATPALWLRDGRRSVMIDPREIVLISSAGNYVEYLLTGSRRHLIRSTLQAKEQRLKRFGVARVYRTRLVNIGRIVGLTHRPTGDFELKLDSGELVVGSRRYRTTVAAIGKT